MKKLIALTLAVAATLSFWGCRKKDPNPTTDTQPSTTTAPADDITVLPDPSVETNIPDPTVDSNSTENGSLIDDITEMTEG